MRSIGSPLAVSITIGTCPAAPGSARMRRHLQPIHVGQHQVQNDQIRHALAQALQSWRRRQPCSRSGPGAQVLRHHLGQSGVVFNHQNMCAHGDSVGCTDGAACVLPGINRP